MKKFQNGITLIELMIAIAFIAIVVGALLGSLNVYGYMYRENYTGKVYSVESAIPQGGLVGVKGSKVFSKGVILAINAQTFVSFSTEDRQWAAVKSGDCVKASADPYAPWNLGSAGTLHNGRMLSKLPNPQCDFELPE